MIAVRDLSRRFGEFALEGIALDAPAGSYTVLLGPSGCGKSLLLETLAGLHRPDRGTIRVGDRDITGLPAEQRPVGLVFQEPSLFPHLDVTGNIAYGLRVTGVAPAERDARVDRLVGLLRLQHLRRRPVGALSGGEAQRVALARTLVMQPTVLLLDEPLSRIDENVRRELQEELGKLHRELGLTTLHVTHSRDEADALADRAALMLDGRILQTGALEAMRQRPICPFAAWFLGADGPGGPRPEGCDASCLGSGAGRCSRQARG